MDKNKEMETNKNQEMVSEDKGSKLFRKAFYDEAREIEARAEKVDLEIDEDRMEAMYQRIMAKAAGQEKPDGENIPDEASDSATEAIRDKTVDIPEEGMAKDISGRMTVYARKPWKCTLRWVAVLALVCAGVFGVSMQSQAGKDGLWSSIQRLIGVESRWEQKDNDEEREYSDPEELDAIRTIESELGVSLPEFFYWPKEVLFQEYEIKKNADSFVIIYQKDTSTIYLEGWVGAVDSSGMSSMEGQGETSYKEYEGVR
ncbi:MAG: hypothetical protein V8S26_10035 [Lachnospiraceae bacterium]